MEGGKNSKAGHRDRLRRRFVDRAPGALDEVHLLELLLTYAVPQKDVQPLARMLLNRFGSLPAVLETDLETLSAENGVKFNVAVLLKLTDWLRTRFAGPLAPEAFGDGGNKNGGRDESAPVSGAAPIRLRKESQRTAERTPRKRSGLFGKSMLREAIKLLPTFPEIDSVDGVRKFLRNSLHFSAHETRRRYAAYITSREIDWLYETRH